MSFPLSLVSYILRNANIRKIFKKLGPEDIIASNIANYLRAQTVQGKLKAVWTKIPNEVADAKHPVFGKKMSWLGKMSGAPDYVVVGASCGLWIEVKIPKGKLSPDQETFMSWCDVWKCPHYRVQSLEEVEVILKEHQLLS